MLFNSIDFAVFLPIVFILYWFVLNKNLKYQNLLILVASYVFYGWWDWRFLTLIIASSFVDYFVGIGLRKQENRTKRKILLLVSIVVNIGLLGFFKYYNFFIENLVDSFTFFGGKINAQGLDIVLPIGISFYTFQTLSYSIDVYRRKIEPTNNIIAFFAFVSFFPQLVAGPIERAKNLLPQFYLKRILQDRMAIDGCFQILWGLFKKIVIADNAAELVNVIFLNSDASGSILLLGAFLFAFQIYCDFSGYSDIAIGTANLFGFKIMINFRFPYFSRDIAEFWRRWHISLSTWFRDYLYIPLGGSRGNIWIKIRNVFIIFIVSGFWHGASWTFIIWGTLNAFYFLPLLLTNTNRNNLDVVAQRRITPSIREALSILFTFSLTLFAWIFFRAESLNHAFIYIKGIFNPSFFSIPKLIGAQNFTMIIVLVMIVILIIAEWAYRKKDYVFHNFYKKGFLTQALLLTFIVSLLFIFGGTQQAFIYFQF